MHFDSKHLLNFHSDPRIYLVEFLKRTEFEESQQTILAVPFPCHCSFRTEAKSYQPNWSQSANYSYSIDRTAAETMEGRTNRFTKLALFSLSPSSDQPQAFFGSIPFFRKKGQFCVLVWSFLVHHNCCMAIFEPFHLRKICLLQVEAFRQHQFGNFKVPILLL